MNLLVLAEIEKEILSLACEDYFGLYEIIWEVSKSNPEIGESEKILVAATAVQSLLNQGLIQLYDSQWSTQQHKPVSKSILYTNPKLWQPSEHYVSLVATDAGEKVYFNKR